MDIINYSNEQINKIPDDSFSLDDFINNVVHNLIYTKIKLGQPSQEIITWIDSEEYSYFLFKDICIVNSKFDEDKSITFVPNYDKEFFYSGYGKTIYVNETIILSNDINNKEIKIQQFPIMFMKDPTNDEFYNQRHSKETITGNTCATIGLRYTGNYHDDISKNFLLVLKNLDIIDDYTLFFEYNKNNAEEFLILGGYPDDIFARTKKKYELKNQKTTHIKLYNRFKPQWGFQCDEVVSGEEKLTKLDIAIHHNLGVIYGTSDYQEMIEKNYFNYYFNLKICTKQNDETYTIYFCDKKKFDENEMKKFPELKFVKIELEESFNLTYHDLFFTKGNNVYFLIVFHSLYNEVWELGKPFLKKYSFVYNFDSKLIWYYKINNSDNSDNIEKKIDKNRNKRLFGIILCLSIFLGIVCFVIGRIIFNKSKNNLIKAEELEQNFSYQKKYNHLSDNVKIIDE